MSPFPRTFLLLFFSLFLVMELLVSWGCWFLGGCCFSGFFLLLLLSVVLLLLLLLLLSVVFVTVVVVVVAATAAAAIGGSAAAWGPGLLLMRGWLFSPPCLGDPLLFLVHFSPALLVVLGLDLTRALGLRFFGDGGGHRRPLLLL